MYCAIGRTFSCNKVPSTRHVIYEYEIKCVSIRDACVECVMAWLIETVNDRITSTLLNIRAHQQKYSTFHVNIKYENRPAPNE